MTWWSTYIVSEWSNEKKIITEILTLSLQTIYHFVLFFRNIFCLKSPTEREAITAQLSSPGPSDRCCMESPDESSRCRRRAEHRQSRRSRWTRKRWAFRSFGVWVGRKKKTVFIVVEMINCIKMKSERENSKIAFFLRTFWKWDSLLADQHDSDDFDLVYCDCCY